jgi:F-type H+-transporting ATPase subunit delta
MNKFSLKFARAIFVAIDQKNSAEVAQISTELTLVAKVLNEKLAREFFANSQISIQVKDKIIEKIFLNFKKEIFNLLKILNQKNGLGEIAEIAESFQKIASDSAGIMSAEVESATKLETKKLADLQAALEKTYQKKISLKVKQNKDLLGGMKIKLGDEVIDVSLAGKLRKLEQAVV